MTKGIRISLIISLIVAILLAIFFYSTRSRNQQITNQQEVRISIEDNQSVKENAGVPHQVSVNEAKEQLSHFFNEALAYLGSSERVTIGSYNGNPNERPTDIVPKNLLNYFDDKELAINFLYELNLTTPNGELHFGQGEFTSSQDLITPKAGDHYEWTQEPKIENMTLGHGEENYTLLNTLDYKAKNTHAHRVIEIKMNDRGKIIDYHVIQNLTEHAHEKDASENSISDDTSKNSTDNE